MGNETKTNFQQPFSTTGLEHRVRRYDIAIRGLLVRQNIMGRVSDFSRGARHASFFIRLSNPLQLGEAIKLAEPLALSCGVNAVLAQRVNGLVSYQVQLPELYWQYYVRADLPMPQAVGLGERRRPVVFELDPPHSLIAGATQTSGKSTTVKSILISLMTTHSVSDLGIVICDPHGDYAPFENEAHLVRFEFGSIARTSEQIKTALRWADQTLAYRMAEDIKDARTIVIVVDEAEAVLTGDNLTICQNIAKQSAKYNMHLIVATQKPSQKALPLIVDNCLNRYIGQLADADLSAKISGHSGLMAHKLTGKGDFLHIAKSDVQRFQVAQATRQDFDRLERIEVAPVEVESADVVELPNTLPARPAGRPKSELSAKWLAYYFFHHPDKISHKAAQELGLTRDFHVLHRDFCREFVAEWLKLRNSRILGA
jgi:S-DNA-T family DNA segregation ATPase FtsK/SpoIIIE